MKSTIFLVYALAIFGAQNIVIGQTDTKKTCLQALRELANTPLTEASPATKSPTSGNVVQPGRLQKPYQEANPKIRSLRIAVIVPNRQSAVEVLGRKTKVSEQQFQVFDQLALGYKLVKGAQVFRENEGISLLDDYIPTSDGEVVLLVGHSEEAKFCFPDSTRVPLNEIHEYAREKNIHLMILTCGAPDFNLTRKVSFQKALSIVEDLEQSISSQDKTKTAPCKHDIVTTVQLELRRENFKVALAVVAAIGGGAGFVVQTVGDDDDEKREESNKKDSSGRETK